MQVTRSNDSDELYVKKHQSSHHYEIMPTTTHEYASKETQEAYEIKQHLRATRSAASIVPRACFIKSQCLTVLFLHNSRIMQLVANKILKKRYDLLGMCEINWTSKDQSDSFGSPFGY